MPGQIKESRFLQAKMEIERFFETVESWKQRRIEDDAHRGQHHSQIKAVTEQVIEAAGIIKLELENLDIGALALGDVYAKCYQTERRMVWLWRVFEFFRSKFDQRDDPVLRPVLEAADEVVWSCYRPFFQNSGIAVEPAPLSFVGEDYSPAALRKDAAPGSLYKIGKDFAPLEDYLNQLPIPLLQLPPNIVSAPWALVLIGHEVGHFIQPLIEEDYDLTFGDILAEAVKAAGGSEEMQQCWREWSPEVFADWYSVLTMGQWALWAMAQYEFQAPADMLSPRGQYPSALARLHLLARLVDLYIPDQGALILQQHGLSLDQLSAGEHAEELAMIPAVAAAICRPLPAKLGDLQVLLNFEAGEYRAQGKIEKYAGRLLTDRRPETDRRINTARYLAAGTAQALSKAAGDANSDLPQVNLNLKESLNDIINSASEGRRSPPAKRIERKPGNNTLLDFLDKVLDDEGVKII